MMKDIFVDYKTFQKPEINPLMKLLAAGLADKEGDQWAKHRKIINPAFNLQNIKVRNIEITFGPLSISTNFLEPSSLKAKN